MAIGFRDANGTDFDDLFEPKGHTDKGSDTGFIYNGSDISNRYMWGGRVPSPVYNGAIGFKMSNGTDLGNFFQKKGSVAVFQQVAYTSDGYWEHPAPGIYLYIKIVVVSGGGGGGGGGGGSTYDNDHWVYGGGGGGGARGCYLAGTDGTAGTQGGAGVGGTINGGNGTSSGGTGGQGNCSYSEKRGTSGTYISGYLNITIGAGGTGGLGGSSRAAGGKGGGLGGLSCVSGALQGSSYYLDSDANNFASCFVYGSITRGTGGTGGAGGGNFGSNGGAGTSGIVIITASTSPIE